MLKSEAVRRAGAALRFRDHSVSRMQPAHVARGSYLFGRHGRALAEQREWNVIQSAAPPALDLICQR
ncbi:MAG: hypothetical protein DMG61_23390 [Acidobacteria bacterium]|nr:MAG: hypothetical protein DMG61_23390 [Acidobacteriota bacterium]